VTTAPRAAAVERDVELGRRIALARWVATALGLVEAFTASPSPLGCPVVPCVLVALVALYNVPLTMAGRRLFPGSRPLVMLAGFADVLLCSALVALGSNVPKDRSFILFFPVLVECAVLARWRGVLPACAAALLSITGSLLLGALHFHNAAGVGDAAFRLVTILIVAVFAGGFAAETHREHSALVDDAATDPLTGARNRRALNHALTALPRVPYAIVAIDVDNLKPINDEYGHEAGDLVLRTTARVVSEIARSGDIVARVGGDEFAVVLLALEAAEAVAVAQRICAAMRGTSISRGRLRVSLGVAVGEAGADGWAVWRSADAALLEAKRGGGDRVCEAPGMVGQVFEPSHTTAVIEGANAQRGVATVEPEVLEIAVPGARVAHRQSVGGVNLPV
jgi:diguanylate cyclase (GGDEF)-like protein